MAVGAGARHLENRVYMTHSRPAGQCWHTRQMAAIRWAYGFSRQTAVRVFRRAAAC
ncbi:protein of unknown function [Bradyrhizobium vignae]|uniref:Uncharacterized protein n=1 Tax=Bradyrhizobium vignae TaxID=1549949 RepID=A0A2U3Q867_9BRAD|nr:protein of unknown function [Bradyrhizobium vignae]